MLHSVGRALRAPSQRTWPQPCERPRSRPRPSALAAHAAARGARGARDARPHRHLHTRRHSARRACPWGQSTVRRLDVQTARVRHGGLGAQRRSPLADSAFRFWPRRAERRNVLCPLTVFRARLYSVFHFSEKPCIPYFTFLESPGSCLPYSVFHFSETVSQPNS